MKANVNKGDPGKDADSVELQGLAFLQNEATEVDPDSIEPCHPLPEATVINLLSSYGFSTENTRKKQLRTLATYFINLQITAKIGLNQGMLEILV